MKKLFFAFASFALISSAFGADSADVKFNAEMWFRYYNNSNQGVGGAQGAGAAANAAGYADKTGTDTFFTQRTKMGAHWSKGEELGAQITLLSGTVWGNNNTATAADVHSNGRGYAQQSIQVYEAWAFWKAMDNLVVKIGRGALDIADGSLVSKNDQELHPYAFDGVLGAFYTEFAAFNFFGVKGSDGNSYDGVNQVALNQLSKNTEVNFYGISVDLRNLPEALKMVNIHLLEENGFNLATVDNDPFIPGTNNAGEDGKLNRLRYGVTVKGDVANLDYKGSYLGYTGKLKLNSDTVSTDLVANMLDLNVGYTVRDIMNLRVNVAYHMDSGNDGDASKNKHYDGFFYNHYDNGGMMEVLTWGNLTYWKLGVSVEPMESTTASLDYYKFSKTKANDVVQATGGPQGSFASTGRTYTANTDTKDLGNEWDLSFRKKLSNGADAGIRYGLFSPNGDNFGGTTKFQQVMLDTRYSF